MRKIIGFIDPDSKSGAICGYFLAEGCKTPLKSILQIDESKYIVRCDVFQENLQEKYNSGNHGFKFFIPDQFKDGLYHNVKLIDKKTQEICYEVNLIFGNRCNSKNMNIKTSDDEIENSNKEKIIIPIKSEKQNKDCNIKISESNKENKKISETDIHVSVISPVYNASKYLDECIQSLLAQKNINCEFIFIDDNSTDSSLNILHEYEKKYKNIIVLNNYQNMGCASARNIGISIARGEYIGFIDPDDKVSENYYYDLYILAKENDADIAMTNHVVRLDDPSSKSKNMGFAINKKITDERRINIFMKTGVSWNKIYKRSFMLYNNILYPEINTMGTDNYITICSLFFANNIVTTNKSTYFYRLTDNSIINKEKDPSYFRLSEVYYRILTRIKNSNKSKAIKDKWINAINERLKIDTISNIEKFKNNFDKIQYLNDFHRIFNNITINEIQRPIVSLTSYPLRISTVYKTITSILNQDITPKKILLYLADSQFHNKEKELPEELINLRNDIFEIRWCNDIKSYKKLIPALKDFSDEIIITADDDLIYPKHWLRTLMTGYFKNPHEVQCMRARRIVRENKVFSPYRNFRLISDKTDSSFYILQTGLGGCLYTKNMFYKDIDDEQLFTQICPDGDDIWFWAMAVLNGTKIHWCYPGLNDPDIIEGTQESALWLSNKNNINDENFRRVYSYYQYLFDKIL